MRWPGIVDVFGPFLRKTEVFADDKHWEDLHTRVIEHVRLSLLLNGDLRVVLIAYPHRMSESLQNIIPALPSRV